MAELTWQEHAAMLRAAAKEMYSEGHDGWPNACNDAADFISRNALKLDQMKGFRDECERQFQAKVAEIGELQSRLAACELERDQAKYGEQDLENQLNSERSRLEAAAKLVESWLRRQLPPTDMELDTLLVRIRGSDVERVSLPAIQSRRGATRRDAPNGDVIDAVPNGKRVAYDSR